MLQYTSFRLVILVLCGSLLFNYLSTEDCKYQLLMSSSCYITGRSPSDDILPCSIKTCSTASHNCVYTGSGQDFNYLVFNCSSSVRSNVNCTFRRTSWSLYNNFTALFNGCLINEATCDILTLKVSNCVLNSYSTTYTQVSTTTSKVFTSLGSITPSTIIKPGTDNTTPSLFPLLTVNTSSGLELIEVTGNKSLFIGLTAGLGAASIVFINVLIVACLCYKIRKSRNANSNLRSFQTPILVISESQNSDSYSQECTADLTYHQPDEQNQKNCFAVYNNENSSPSHYSQVIDIHKNEPLTDTVTYLNTLLVQQDTPVDNVNNSYSAAGLESVKCNNKERNDVYVFISENNEYNGNEGEVQTQDVNQYSTLFDVSRERTSEYNDLSNVTQIQCGQDKRDLE
ncbi:hypothetical protein BgiBS90_028964 [Biomphalaria glabrata]|nr:hypothetical protein BgiBS90_028964 [Biomphalaria glabrata]